MIQTQFNNPYVPAEAERGKFVKLDETTIPGLPATALPRYAMLTYQTNSATTSGGGGSFIEETNLNAVVITGAGGRIETSGYNKFTIHIISTGVTVGGTMTVQTSLDGTNFATVATVNITSNTTHEVAIEGRVYKYIRTNLTARTDGTYTTLLFGGI